MHPYAVPKFQNVYWIAEIASIMTMEKDRPIRKVDGCGMESGT